MKAIVRVTRAASRDEIRKAFAIRMRVFVREQGVPAEIELDRDDGKAIHFLALNSGKAVGTARIVIRRGRAKIGRMAVLKSYRGMGVGSMLLKRAIETAKKRRARTIYLHAQVAVMDFYETADFRAAGPVFDEAAIPHRRMIWTKRPPTR